MKTNWEYLYPKQYQYIPKGYVSPKQIANAYLSMFGNSLIEELLSEYDAIRQKIVINKISRVDISTEEMLAFIVLSSVKYSMPHFFVSENLLESLRQTDLRTDIKPSVPFDGFFLHLPACSYPSVIAVGKITCNPTNILMSIPDCLCNTYKCINKCAFDGLNYGELTTKILQALAAKPVINNSSMQLIAEDEPRTKSGACFWTPNWIGKDYQIKRQNISKGGTNSSPRTHWRRGHFREQPIGEGRIETKTIWIEPTLVS